MSLILKAFGQSAKYSIKERAEIIIDLHSKVCKLLGHYDWKLYNSKTVEIDIRDIENCFQHVISQVKKGLNAKVVRPIRYKDDDIADITSNCRFYNTEIDSFDIDYSIGFPSYYGFPAKSFGIKNIKDEKLFTKEKIIEIAKLVIETWKPDTLCVTNSSFLHELSKSNEYGTPWTGWFTYVSNEIEPNESKTIISIIKPKSINRQLEKLNLAKIESIFGLGKIYWVCDERFDDKNIEHVNKALELEKYFKNNDVILTHRKNGSA